LDEELIGIFDISEKMEILETIHPHYIILKPSLHGGISGSKEWIKLSEERKISWWMTSALESNIGLNAICQFTAEYVNELPQGLGTGSLYLNNIESDLVVENGFIFKR
jgi:O-succinylbenzoate synthase